jgi:hypothetical protein
MPSLRFSGTSAGTTPRRASGRHSGQQERSHLPGATPDVLFSRAISTFLAVATAPSRPISATICGSTRPRTTIGNASCSLRTLFPPQAAASTPWSSMGGHSTSLVGTTRSAGGEIFCATFTGEPPHPRRKFRPCHGPRNRSQPLNPYRPHIKRIKAARAVTLFAPGLSRSFDPIKIKWQILTDGTRGEGPGKRSGHAMSVVNGGIFLFGGGGVEENTFLDSLWVYDTAGHRFRKSCTSPPFPLPPSLLPSLPPSLPSFVLPSLQLGVGRLNAESAQCTLRCK